MEPAARVAFKTVIAVLPRLSSVKQIHFVLLHDADVRVHEGILEGLIG